MVMTMYWNNPIDREIIFEDDELVSFTESNNIKEDENFSFPLINFKD